MNSLRRTILAGTGTILAGLGGLWAVLSNDGNENTDDSSSGSNNSTTRGAPTAQNASGNQSSAETDAARNDLPEAATPEANPGVETNDSVIANASEVGQTEPTAEDVTLSKGSLTTGSKTATAKLTTTNNADVALTIDVHIVLLSSGKTLGTAWGGVTGLQPGRSATITAVARGKSYSKAVDFDILEKQVSPAIRR